jgi:serine/threonine protein kinase
MSTVLRSGIQMLRAIEALHECGIIHRDIKPSNFLIRPSRKYPVALIDYGLSRVFRDFRTGEIIPPRERPGFVGTAKYASLNAHNGRELGRRDDLFSWFFSLMEMLDGSLPWAGTRDKQRIHAIKLNTDILSELEEMPKQMRNVYRLIRRLEYDEEPNYGLLISFMVQAMDVVGASWDDPYEWEILDDTEISPISLRPDSDEEVELPDDLPPPVMPPRTVASFMGEDQWRTKSSSEFGQLRKIYHGIEDIRPRKFRF